MDGIPALATGATPEEIQLLNRSTLSPKKFAPARRSIASAGVILLSVLMAGCANDSTGSAGGSTSSSAAASDHYPVTVQNCGRDVTFDKAPSRTFLGYQSAAELFFGLGLGERAIAQVQPVDKPLSDQAADFESVPDESPDPYVPVGKEQMLNLRPDFLFAYVNSEYGGPDELAPGLATLDDFDSIGANVYALVCPDEDPIPIDATYRAVEDLGKIFDVESEATATIEDMQARIDEVKRRVEGLEPVPVFYYYGGEGPFGTWGKGSYLDAMIELAGGENVFGDAEGGRRGYLEVSQEKVAATDPAYFLVNGSAMDDNTVEDRADYLFRTFPELKASQDRAYGVTFDPANTPGWRWVGIVEELARALHPEAFADLPEAKPSDG